MIAKKDWVADGNTSRFLPDIIVRTEDFARVYAYVYDINGVDGQLQTPSLPFKYPTNLYIRTNNVPTSADIITIDNWDLVNNNISFYSKPLSGTTVWIEVATTTEEFGETLTQPAVKRAEDAAIASELSATNAAVSASTATAQATIATTQANTATAQATIATTKASEASLSATNAGISATASATSATASATSATASATSASESATSATASANSATASATSASNASTSETNAANSANSAATSATGAATSLSTFNSEYTSSTTEPTSPVIGMLWFDETAGIMKVYDGNGFINTGSSVNGTSSRNTYTATAGQTTFSATYDSGYVDVYVNGIKLQDTVDFTATNGSTVVLTSGANAGDIVDIVAYGTFELADAYTKNDTDVLLASKVDKVTSTDNAIVRFSGTTGQVQNSGVTIDDSGNITGGSFNGYGGAGFKNFIINGGFDIWQRGSSFTTISSGEYFADRWITYSPSGTMNLEKHSDVYESSQLKWSKNNANVEYIVQRIEDLTRFSGKTITFSFEVLSTQAITLYSQFGFVYDSADSNLFEEDSIPHSIPANTLTTVVHTFTADNATYFNGKSVGDNSYFDVSIKNIDNVNTNIYIPRVQLEEGSVATPFEQRPYGLELSLCQRYYETSGSANEFYELPVSSGTQIQRQSVSYKVSKRTVPTVTRTRISYSTSSSSVAHSWEDGFQMDFVGGQYAFESYTWTADAEL